MISSSSHESTFSLERIRRKILEGHALVDWHCRAAEALTDAIVAAEGCLMNCQQDNSASEQQALVDAVRHLDELLNGATVTSGPADNRDVFAEGRIARGMSASVPMWPSLAEMMGDVV